MNAHKIETTIETSGTLTLENLPFEAGEKVEIIILETENGHKENLYPLRGKLLKYDDPFEPAVPIEDWEALK